MNKLFPAAFGLAIVIVLVSIGVWYSGNSAPSYPGIPEPVTIGVKPAEDIALFYIAEDRGFFAKNGLNVTLVSYTTKLQAFSGMQKSDVDFAIISEYPVVAAIFEQKDISIIGSTSRFQDQYLAANPGIRTVSDLNGRKIGLPAGTISEFYCGRFLNLNGVRLEDVTTKNVPFLQAGDSLENGSVDAVLIFDGAPRSKEILSEGNFTLWNVQSGQASYDLLVSRKDWVVDHPEDVQKLLRSLVQAEEWFVSNPAGGKAITQKAINRSDADIATIWPRFQFSLTLDQSLISAMEDEARWMIANHLTNATTVPDFRDFVSRKGLETVKPGSVRIIG
ncbi:MAG: NrtA/SsuA/CpmA family ABC transporter substrate-binding protein [Methanomicrobiales archaeon]|nr:NrtA/SsuA/CpmA family ABC transporter substrate-binding protein [Methanomicrobiales archaeon]